VAVVDDYGETNDERPPQVHGEFYYYQWPMLDRTSIGFISPVEAEARFENEAAA
jgi:hypothetical protein